MSKYIAKEVDTFVENASRYLGLAVSEMLTEYATLLRERESAKAAVTDEMIERAARAMCRKFDPPSSLDEMATCDKWRRFADEARCCLEAVMPMLASRDRDAYEGAREDFLDWKGRAQRAEATLRSLGFTGIEANEAPRFKGCCKIGHTIWSNDCPHCDAMLASARVPDGMIERIDAAIQRINDGHAPRRIPADPTDVDLVLAEVRAYLKCEKPPFWIAAAPKHETEE